MLRTAAKSVVGYVAMHEELGRLAKDGRALAHSRDPRVRPDGWDSNAFCTNLAFARQGMGLGVDRHAESLKAGFMLASSSSAATHPPSRKSIQSDFYSRLQSLEKCDWIATVKKKVMPGLLTSLLTGLGHPLSVMPFARFWGKAGSE